MTARLFTFINRFRQSDFIRNTTIMITGTGIAQLIPVLIIPILTRLYTPEDIGILATFISFFTIFSIIAGGRYEYAVIMPSSDQDGTRLFQIAGGLAIVFGLLLYLVVMVIGSTITLWLGTPSLEPWLWLLPLAVTAQGLFMTFSFGLNRKKDYQAIARGKISQSGSTAILQILGGMGGFGIAGLIVGKVAGVCTSTIWLFLSLFRKHSGYFHRESWTNLKKTASAYEKYPLFNAPHALTTNVSNNFPVLLYISFFSESIVGFYAMAIRACYAPIQIISTAFGQVLGKKLADIHNDNGNVHSYVLKVLVSLLIIGIVPFSLLFAAGPGIFGFILGDEWSVTGEYIRILTPWVYLTFVSQPLNYIPLLYNRQKMAFGLDIIHLVLRMIAIFIGIWLENIIIALACFSVVGSVMMIVLMVWYVNICKKSDK